ncbi:hypothetical protein MHY87_07055 [Microvirga sp. ACRRW]|uniref:hypothetical protein n=1 Tax=Microvirga sp. ACRRW TaxID=2918205 RepID=UPI001EF42F73|nr:hypothetical protein [Microvirga sp. ACRRW]MCG7392660.1 hypothetical protein [Microvirga sp. ACRRW]
MNKKAPKKPELKPLDTYDLKTLEGWIDAFRRHNLTDDPDFARLLQERERRGTHGLSFETTRLAIYQAAAEGRFLTYKEVADASGAPFAKVRYQIGAHLTRLCEYAHRQGWPLISSIVVNQDGRETGSLQESALGGFITVARDLGYAVTDEEAFLKDQQERTFAWGQAPLALQA